MANVLTMAKIQSIQQLHAATGWSQRRIADELDIDRGTVSAIPTIVAAGPKTSHSARRLSASQKCSHFFAATGSRARADEWVATAPIARRGQMQPFRPPGFRKGNSLAHPAAGTPSISGAAGQASASRSAS